MPLAIDWGNKIIQITSPTTNVDMQELHDFIEDAMASPEGLNYPAIISPEGKIEDPSNPGVYSQIIIILQSPWQIQFWGGSGYTRIYGGKLVGGYNDQPLKATGTAGDISVLESPVDGVTVVSGSGITAQDKDDIVDLMWNESKTGHTGDLKTMADNIDQSLSLTESNILAEIAAVKAVVDSILTNTSTNLPALIEQLKEHNISYRFVEATVQIPARNVGIGVVNYIEIKYKLSEDPNWDDPEDSGNLYYWYENMNDINPIYVGEEV